MKFKSEFYGFQQDILKIFQEQLDKKDRKIHIVSPPGSGKTIVGIEILQRLGGSCLILVPNTTLREQWKNKIQTLFLEDHEDINSLVSCERETIRPINILTYQSISVQSGEDSIDELVMQQWFETEEDYFSSFESFQDFLGELKQESEEEYKTTYNKYLKKIRKNSQNSQVSNFLHSDIQDYFKKLKDEGVKNILVDESHHLTSWWSKVIYHLWNSIDDSYIIGLTATPPFDDIDYFKLDEDYKNLLGEVDYHLPTPAVVKSGKLAPYSDLVYFVSPSRELHALLKENYENLERFIEENANDIAIALHTYIEKNIESLRRNHRNNLKLWISFTHLYLPGNIDITYTYDTEEITQINIEVLAKSCGKYCHLKYRNIGAQEQIQQIKEMFYKVGYIWRKNNFYKFETPHEKALIYSETKLEAIEKIVSQEMKVQKNHLRAAIITDFVEHEEYGIHCKKILKYISINMPQLCPYLVTGQGIWKFAQGDFIELESENILSITQKLQAGETNLIIGTRGILGEGWDCPELNTLIDLTGVSSYMSVNQIHGRAIRKDTSNDGKVANIYNIVCLGEGLNARYDYERIKRKQEQFYGVDDLGNIIKGVDHIYPQIEDMIQQNKIQEINSYTMQKIAMRDMVYSLWGIGSGYKNQETFSLSLKISKVFDFYPIPKNLWQKILYYRPHEQKKVNMLQLGNTKYHHFIRSWLENMLETLHHTLIIHGDIEPSSGYVLNHTQQGDITIQYQGEDTLEAKKYIQILYELFSSQKKTKYIYTEKYKDHSALTLFFPNILAGNKLKRALLLNNKAQLSKRDRIRFVPNRKNHLKGRLKVYNPNTNKVQNYFSVKIEKIWI